MDVAITPPTDSSHTGVSKELREAIKFLSDGAHSGFLRMMSFTEYKKQALSVLQKVVDVIERVYPTDDVGFPLFGDYAVLGYTRARAFNQVAFIPHVIPASQVASDTEVFQLRDNPAARSACLERVHEAIQAFPLPMVRVGCVYEENDGQSTDAYAWLDRTGGKDILIAPSTLMALEEIAQRNLNEAATFFASVLGHENGHWLYENIRGPTSSEYNNNEQRTPPSFRSVHSNDSGSRGEAGDLVDWVTLRGRLEIFNVCKPESSPFLSVVYVPGDGPLEGLYCELTQDFYARYVDVEQRQSPPLFEEINVLPLGTTFVGLSDANGTSGAIDCAYLFKRLTVPDRSPEPSPASSPPTRRWLARKANDTSPLKPRNSIRRHLEMRRAHTRRTIEKFKMLGCQETPQKRSSDLTPTTNAFAFKKVLQQNSKGEGSPSTPCGLSRKLRRQ